MAGRDRTCGAPRFRRALYRLSYGHMLCERRWGNLPVPQSPSTGPLRGQALRSPLATPDARYGPRSASASAVLPSLPWATRRRPNLCASPSISQVREIDAVARSEPGFPSHSPTLRPWIAYRRPTWRGFGARCLVRSWKIAGKSTRLFTSAISSAERRGSFSLRRGLDSI